MQPSSSSSSLPSAGLESKSTSSSKNPISAQLVSEISTRGENEASVASPSSGKSILNRSSTVESVLGSARSGPRCVVPSTIVLVLDNKGVCVSTRPRIDEGALLNPSMLEYPIELRSCRIIVLIRSSNLESVSFLKYARSLARCVVSGDAVLLIDNEGTYVSKRPRIGRGATFNHSLVERPIINAWPENELSPFENKGSLASEPATPKLEHFVRVA